MKIYLSYIRSHIATISMIDWCKLRTESGDQINQPRHNPPNQQTNNEPTNKQTEWTNQQTNQQTNRMNQPTNKPTNKQNEPTNKKPTNQKNMNQPTNQPPNKNRMHRPTNKPMNQKTYKPINKNKKKVIQIMSIKHDILQCVFPSPSVTSAQAKTGPTGPWRPTEGHVMRMYISFLFP